MDKCWSRSRSRFNSWTVTFLNMQKWLAWEFRFNPLIICRWYITFFSNKHLSAQSLNEDLNKISHWDFQWKMSFNPDPSKQAPEVIFSRKLQKSVYPPLHFNNIAVTQSTTQKHLVMVLVLSSIFKGISRTYTVKSTKQ